MISKETIEKIKKKKEKEKGLQSIIKDFCKKNNITKNNRTYSFRLGDTLYKVSNHTLNVTGTKNNYTIYDTYRDSGKKSEKIVFIYDNDNKIMEIYENLKKEYQKKLNNLLNKQQEDLEEEIKKSNVLFDEGSD